MTFSIPKQPKIKLKDKQPDQRQIAVMPLRALADKRLDNQAIRVFGLVCSYANRAGITWVSRKTIGDILKVTPQAISTQVAQLKRYGYIEVVRKGYKGQRTETIRIVYNPDIKLHDALANASSTEDLRSPQMKHEEIKEMNETLLNKSIKNKKVIVKGNNKGKTAVSDNKLKEVGEMYVRWFKEEKVITENDKDAMMLVERSKTDWSSYIEQLEVQFKMIASEGLRKPDDVLALTVQILADKGL